MTPRPDPLAICRREVLRTYVSPAPDLPVAFTDAQECLGRYSSPFRPIRVCCQPQARRFESPAAFAGFVWFELGHLHGAKVGHLATVLQRTLNELLANFHNYVDVTVNTDVDRPRTMYIRVDYRSEKVPSDWGAKATAAAARILMCRGRWLCDQAVREAGR